jgi:hypothetical protein
MEQDVLRLMRNLLEIAIWKVEFDLHRITIWTNNDVTLTYTKNGHLTVLPFEEGHYCTEEREILKKLSKNKLTYKVEEFLEVALITNWKYIHLMKHFE